VRQVIKSLNTGSAERRARTASRAGVFGRRADKLIYKRDREMDGRFVAYYRVSAEKQDTDCVA